jgi:integrase
MDAYQAALAASTSPSDIGAKRSGPGTVTALVALYANSSQFKHEIATETRRTMWAILQKFRDEHGSKRVALLRREHVLAILDGRPPFAKRNWLRALRPLLDFAVSIKWIAENPTTDIKAKVPRKGEGFRAWGEEQIAAFRQRHALGTRARLAMELFLNTAQRRGDVVRMGPQHIRDDPEHGPILHVAKDRRIVASADLPRAARGDPRHAEQGQALDVPGDGVRQAIFARWLHQLVPRRLQRSWLAWF